MSDNAQATIRVSRKDPRDVKLRQVHLYLDGQPFATLDYGQEAEVQTAPGGHELRAYNTLFSKVVKFEVQDGEELRFVTGNRAGGCLLLIGASLGAGMLTVFLEREPGLQDAAASRSAAR